eukprot:TRINITY_DN7148_c0_g1_i1.p1 TRINITY_DN7148_c0_g1~~TRINITY_DN7148_c0_g1_i1.p1  ORF type:complete len:711 (+),score=115.32 TRINITY_DN7148_c0_g1_i1:43-2175(+)
MPRFCIRETASEAHKAGAALLLRRIRQHYDDDSPDRKEKLVLLLSTGNDALSVYKYLVDFHKRNLISFKNVVIFMTHEFCVGKEHPASIHTVMWNSFLKHIDIEPGNVHIMNGLTDTDAAATCADFDNKMAALGGIDLAFCCPELDANIGFNMNGSSLSSKSRLKTFAHSTCLSYANSFNGIENIPKRGFTVGMASVMSATDFISVCTGEGMQQAVVALADSSVSHVNCLSLIQYHSGAIIIADDAACSELRAKTVRYFSFTQRRIDPKDFPEEGLEKIKPLPFTPPPTSKGSGVLRVVNILLLRNGELRNDELWVRHGKVISPAQRFWEAHNIKEYAAEWVLDGRGCICTAGLIDLQINGAFGVDFSSPSLTTEQINVVTKGVLSHGCTSICPTVITSSPETYRAVLPLLPRRKGGPELGANMLGTHLEGPFLSELKYGAHDINYVRAPTQGFHDAVKMYSVMESVCIVTLAPELEGSLDTIKGLTDNGVVVSLGHSSATLGEAEEGVRWGASLVTHMFNAMRSFNHRDPGIVGILGSKIAKRPHFGIIVDGLHTHPVSVRMAYNAHPAGCVLVTDAMEAMGMPPGSYRLAGKEVTVVDTTVFGGGRAHKATLSGTDILAGAVPSLIDCVRNFINFTECTVAQGFEAATLRPAEAINIQETKGHLNFGADADFSLFHPTSMDPIATFVAGELSWSADDSLLAGNGLSKL